MLAGKLKSILLNTWLNPSKAAQDPLAVMFTEFEAGNIPPAQSAPIIDETIKASVKLGQILNQDPDHLVDNIQTFLKERWMCIYDSDAAYCEYAGGAMNKLCVALATAIANDQDKPIASILMPTLEAQEYVYESLEETTETRDGNGERVFTPHRFIVAAGGSAVINIADWFNIQESPFHPSLIYLHDHNLPLSENALAALRVSVKPYSEYFFDNIDKCKELSKRKGNLYYDMEDLIKGLLDGGKRVTKVASDLDPAGVAAHKASEKFIKLWDTIPLSEKEALIVKFNHDDKNDLKLYVTILRKSVYVRLSAEEEAYLTQKNLQPHQTCVESTANILDIILKKYKDHFMKIKTGTPSTQENSNPSAKDSEIPIMLCELEGNLHKDLLADISKKLDNYGKNPGTFVSTSRYPKSASALEQILEVYLKEPNSEQIRSAYQLDYFYRVLSHEAFIGLLHKISPKKKGEFLVETIKAKHRQGCLLLIQQGADLYVFPPPLVIAIENELDDVVNEIIKDKNLYTLISLLDQDGDNALHGAAIFNKPEWVKIFLEKGEPNLHLRKNKDGATAFIRTVREGFLDVLEIFLAMPDAKKLCFIAKKDQWTPLHLAASNGYDKIYTRLIQVAGSELYTLKNDEGKTPIDVMLDSGYDSIMLAHLALFDEKLCKDPAYANSIAKCMNRAIRMDRSDLVLEVLKKMSPEASSLILPCKSNDGETVLIFAIRAKDLILAKAILEKSSSDLLYIKCNDGWSSIHHAARNGFYEMANLLLSYTTGELYALAKPDKWTPLHLAATNGHVAVFKTLIKAGGLEVTLAVNDESHTALRCAENNNHSAIIDAFIECLDEKCLSYKKNQDALSQILRNYLSRSSPSINIFIEKIINKLGANYIHAHPLDREAIVYWAAEHGNLEVFKLLLQNAPRHLIFSKNAQGSTLLHVASMREDIWNTPICKFLLGMGGKSLAKIKNKGGAYYNVIGSIIPPLLNTIPYTFDGIREDDDLDVIMLELGFENLCTDLGLAHQSYEALSLYAHAVKLDVQKKQTYTSDQIAELSSTLYLFDLRLKTKHSHLKNISEMLIETLDEIQQHHQEKKQKNTYFFSNDKNILETMPQVFKKISDEANPFMNVMNAKY